MLLKNYFIKEGLFYVLVNFYLTSLSALWTDFHSVLADNNTTKLLFSSIFKQHPMYLAVEMMSKLKPDGGSCC